MILALWAITSILLAPTATAPATASAPADTVSVTVDVSTQYARTPGLWRGLQYDPVTKDERGDQRELALPATPDFGEQIDLVVTANSSVARKLKIAGTITDYAGLEVQKIDQEIDVPAGAAATASIAVKPSDKHAGPFFFTGTWTDGAAKAQGELSLTFSQPNWRQIVQDFERVQYAKTGEVLDSSAAARHRGNFGLLVRLRRPPADPKAPPPPPDAPPPGPPSQLVPLGLSLPQRPVKLGMWVKPSADVTLKAILRDPGIEIRQTRYPDEWVLGPVELKAGDWRYVELALPVTARSEKGRKPYGEAGGIVDYPLTLTHLELSGPENAEICLDDVEVHAAGPQDGAWQLRAVTDKPGGLIYRNDKLAIAVTNAALSAKPADVFLSVDLVDISGLHYVVHGGDLHTEPGVEAVREVAVANLPLGVYRLEVQVRKGQEVLASSPRSATLLVYEPSGKPLPTGELHTMLADRGKMLLDLGLSDDIVLVPWQSVDGSLSAERTQGDFSYDFIRPRVDAIRSGGVHVIGRLGYCALWADPGTTYLYTNNYWNGNAYVLPGRMIYWEEYVLRTAEEFADAIDTWIVWDRPDSDAFGGSPEDFAEGMLEVSYKAIREANPKARIISGGITLGSVEPYLLALSQAGATKYLDAIGILPSTTPLAPEDGYLDVVLARAARIRRQEKIAPPLCALGLAWSTGDGANRVSESDQAIYVARAYVLCRAGGVDQIILQPDATEDYSRRDSADLVYQEGPLLLAKPAALSARTASANLAKAKFVREIFLADRREALARAYLFQRDDGKWLLCAWRREGKSELPLISRPEAVLDVFGNTIAIDAAGDGLPQRITLDGAVKYLVFSNIDGDTLARQLEQSPLIYDDAPESAWKQKMTFHLNVGNADDEKACAYEASDAREVGPVDSYYHNDYGRHVVDSGRHISGSESFSVDVSRYGTADLMLRKRINYSLANQLVKVYCNDKFVGQWFAFKRDRRYRWHDIEFVVPNDFFTGKDQARLRFEPVKEGETFTSYYFWAGPIETKTVYASDLSLLVGTSGYGAGPNRDANILGGPLRFFKLPDSSTPATMPTSAGSPATAASQAATASALAPEAKDAVYAKGLGTHAAGSLGESLIVLPLNKQYKTFRATVGIDAASNGEGTVRFRIGDGRRTLFDSQNMNYYNAPKEIEIDVSESILLMLWTDDTGDGSKNDIANWANARLERE